MTFGHFGIQKEHDRLDYNLDTLDIFASTVNLQLLTVPAMGWSLKLILAHVLLSIWML